MKSYSVFLSDENGLILMLLTKVALMSLLRSGGAAFHVFLAVTTIILYIIFNCRVRPEGKPPRLTEASPRGGWEPPAPGAVGDPPGSLPAPVWVAAKAFRGLFYWVGHGKPGGKFLGLLAGTACCGRELDTEGRGARWSHASPPHRFRVRLLLILPPFLITDVRKYQIRSAISYSASAPIPTAEVAET